MSFNLKEYLLKKQDLINQQLKTYLAVSGDYPKEILDAMQYSVFAGGKRLRPILVLAACESIGGDYKTAMRPACAIELIHTYSLIHDDLPAMDDDDYRRGNPTCHKVYGEAMAILAGDALLTYAFELLSQPYEVEGKDISPLTRLQIVQTTAQAAGLHGMIAGQVADMLSEKGSLASTEEGLYYIHKKKTGALFDASIKCGALLAGADGVQQASLAEYGHHFGLAFQIVDDILDVESTFEELGKPTGSDVKNDKLTFPSLYGLEKSKRMAKDHVAAAVASVEGYGEQAVPLVSLVKYVLERKN